MIKILWRVFLVGILAAGLAGCKSNPELADVEKVRISDYASVLSPEMQDSIMSNVSLPGYLVRVVTVDSIDMSDIQGELQAVLDREEKDPKEQAKAVMVVGVKANNTCYIKYGKVYDGITETPVEYSSKHYYALQLNDSVPLEAKVYEMSRAAAVGAQHMGEAYLSHMVCGEALGPLFGLVAPGPGFFYKRIIHPLQYPIIRLIDLTGSFYWGVLLFALLEYALLRLVVRIEKKLLLPRIIKHSRGQEDLKLMWSTCGMLTYVVFWIMPLLMGALSLTSFFGFSGLEAIPDAHKYLGMSYAAIHNIFLSGVASTSLLWVCLSVLATYFALDDPKFSMRTVIMYLFISITLFTTAGFNYVIFLLMLPDAYAGLKVKYDMNRRNGLGKRESSLMPFFYASAVLVGVICGVGFADGFDRVVGAKSNSIAKVRYEKSELRQPQQLMPLQEKEKKAKDNKQAVVEDIKILSPAQEISRESNTAVCQFSIDNLGGRDEAIFVFEVKSGQSKWLIARHYGNLKSGAQDLQFEYYVGGGAKIGDFKGVAVEAPSLIDCLEVTEKGVRNNSKKEIVVLSAEAHSSSGSTFPVYEALMPRGNFFYAEPVRFESLRAYSLAAPHK